MNDRSDGASLNVVVLIQQVHEYTEDTQVRPIGRLYTRNQLWEGTVAINGKRRTFREKTRDDVIAKIAVHLKELLPL